MKILILGGTGRTGIRLIEEGLRRGHQVNTLVRSPEKLILESSDLQITKGTPSNIDALRKALKGAEVIFSTLGISTNSYWPWAKLRTPKDFISSSIRNVIDVMHEEKVKRIIVVSAHGAGDSIRQIPGLFKWWIEHNSNMRHVFKEHGEQEILLKESDLNWTAVRPTILTNSQKTKEIQVSFNGVPKPRMTISRRNVAAFMLDIAENDKYIKQSPTISEK